MDIGTILILVFFAAMIAMHLRGHGAHGGHGGCGMHGHGRGKPAGEPPGGGPPPHAHG